MNISNKKRIYKVRINRVQDYIDNNLDSELNLEMLAKLSTFSTYYFHRIFKSITGETVHKYITRLRCEKACTMLTHDMQKRIIDIAYECGFSSSAAFSKIFKQYYTITPSQWRETTNHTATILTNTDQFNVFDNKNYYDTIFCKENMKQNGLVGYTIKDIPNYCIMYTRRIGPYHTDRTTLWTPLIRWGMAHNLIQDTTMRLGIFHDKPHITPPNKCRYDAGLVLGETYTPMHNNSLFNIRNIPGGKYVIYTYNVTSHTANNPWKDIFSLNLSESGYQLEAKPILERHTEFFNQHSSPQDIFTVEICLPIRPL